MTVTTMREDHLAALAEIERACFHAPWSETALREELGSGLFLVAEEDGRAVGYVGCQTVLDEGYITNVAVSPDHRRRGIAERLLTALREQGKDLAFLTLEVRVSNAPAIALYEKMGYERVGERPNFYTDPKENALLMTYYTEKGSENRGF